MGLVDNIREQMVKAASSALERFSAEDDDVSAEEMGDALEKAGLAEPTEEKPRAMFHDPYSVMDWAGWRERPSQLTYETLRSMSTKNSVVAAIVQTRVNQVSQFARPQQGRYDKGFKVILRDRRDKSRTMTDQEAKQAVEIERMLETTGFLLPDEKPGDRDSFRTFLKKAARDILIYDQWAFERIRDRKGRISRFNQLPSETIRPAVADREHMDAKELRSRVSHVQVYEDTVIAEFSPDDIAWCIMNPRSDLRANNFGFSYLEQTVNLVTAWLFGFHYNQRFFTNGSAIKGVLNVKGAIPDKQLKAFRRMWYNMITGVHNAWRTPILNSEDIQWVSLHSTNREMEYAAWMDWLTKITCAIYGMDPLEINFQFGGAGTGQSSMFDKRPNQQEVQESKDKGLTPLMEFIEDQINTFLVWEMNPDFEFSFTGLDAKSEEKEREGWASEVQHFKLIDEVRAERDEPPLPDGQGQVILNPVWLQNKQGDAAMADEGGGEGDDTEEAPGSGGPAEELPGADEEDEDPQDEGPDNEEDEEDVAKALLSHRREMESELRKARVRETERDGNMTIDIELGS